MFDEQTPQNPNEPEDILSSVGDIPAPMGPVEIKSALANQKLRPVGAPAMGQGMEHGQEMGTNEPQIEITPPFLSRKGIFVMAGIILIGVVAVGTYYVLKGSSNQTAKNVVVQPNVNTGAPITVSPENIPANVPAPEVQSQPFLENPEVATTTINPSAPVDTDADGLTDEEEVKYGTDQTKKDTDEDGLTDYEETMVWHTNPLNPDTDSDSYKDGEEVKNGFNPLGAGKLLELPKQ